MRPFVRSSVLVAVSLSLSLGSFAASSHAVQADTTSTLAAPSPQDNVAVGPPVEGDLRHTKSHGFVVSDNFVASFHGTGPFVRSALLTAYSSIRGSVDLPCNASQLRPLPSGRPGEAAYAYVGGWGANTGSGAPKAVDAGFYQDVAANAYRLFMAYQKPHGWTSDVKAQELKCGQTVSFVFAPLSRTLLGFSATGLNVAGKTVTRQVTMQTAEGDGWWPEGDPHPRLVMPDGEGVLLKVMTTIAQTGPVVSAANWATSGSFFGFNPKAPSPAVIWRDLQVGKAELGPGGKPSKTLTWVDWTGTAGVPITDIWPDHTRAIISIAGGGTSFRTAIDLHPGKPDVPK
jgi:hypothetical protein